MTTAAVDLTECPNCGTPLSAAFCATCGQKAAPLNPSFGEFLHDLLHELVHVDGKIVRSVFLLLARPGFLSSEQFHGRRARYISPIRLYLVFSVLYFAVAAFAPVSTVRISATAGPGDDPRAIEMRRDELQISVNEALTHWLPRAMFALVPVFAGLLALTVRHSGRNYPQHLYFSLHVHAAWFAAATIVALARIATVRIAPAVSTLAWAYGALYFVMALRRAYRVSIAGAIWRVALIQVVYLAAVLAALAAIAFPIIFRP